MQMVQSWNSQQKYFICHSTWLRIYETFTLRRDIKVHLFVSTKLLNPASFSYLIWHHFNLLCVSSHHILWVFPLLWKKIIREMRWPSKRSKTCHLLPPTHHNKDEEGQDGPLDGICLSFEHKRITARSWRMTNFHRPLWPGRDCSLAFFLIEECECACESSMHVCDVEEEVTFKLAHNNQPSPHSPIIPVRNQASMAESTPTAYTPNTLTGNLFSPGAFVCSLEGQPVNRGGGRAVERDGLSNKKMLRYKREGGRTESKPKKGGKRQSQLYILHYH